MLRTVEQMIDVTDVSAFFNRFMLSESHCIAASTTTTRSGATGGQRLHARLDHPVTDLHNPGEDEDQVGTWFDQDILQSVFDAADEKTTRLPFPTKVQVKAYKHNHEQRTLHKQIQWTRASSDDPQQIARRWLNPVKCKT